MLQEYEERVNYWKNLLTYLLQIFDLGLRYDSIKYRLHTVIILIYYYV